MINLLAPESRAAIIAHSQREYPRECGGFVVMTPEGVEVTVPCVNSHSDPENYVRVSVDQQIAAEAKGKLVAFYHSHPNGDEKMTDADKASSEAMFLPWLMYRLPEETWDSYVPAGWIAPLLGRTFVHGVHDCYSLCRDHFKLELNVDLPDFEREDEWWLKNQNLYLENFQKAGFVRVSDLKKNDGILMQVRSPVPNHAAIYLGQNIMLHHLYGRLSCRAPYGGFWLKNTYAIVRHSSLL